MGDMDAMGDMVGTGCAVAATAVPPATMVATSKRPVNQRFIECNPSLAHKNSSRCAPTQGSGASNIGRPDVRHCKRVRDGRIIEESTLDESYRTACAPSDRPGNRAD